MKKINIIVQYKSIKMDCGQFRNFEIEYYIIRDLIGAFFKPKKLPENPSTKFPTAFPSENPNHPDFRRTPWPSPRPNSWPWTASVSADSSTRWSSQSSSTSETPSNAKCWRPPPRRPPARGFRTSTVLRRFLSTSSFRTWFRVATVASRTSRTRSRPCSGLRPAFAVLLGLKKVGWK